MLNKKAIVLRELVLLILSIILLLAFISCTTNTLANVFGSKTGKSYDKLIEIIETMEYDSPQQHSLYLKEDNAIIGFAKDAEVIKFKGVSSRSVKRPEHYFIRPDDCEKDKGCICLCKKFKSDEKLIECSGDIKCNSFDILNFPEEINETILGATEYFVEYKFEGGFFLKKLKLSEWDRASKDAPHMVPKDMSTVPSIIYYPTTINILKERNNKIYISTKPFEISP